jgi:hypothetical protein
MFVWLSVFAIMLGKSEERFARFGMKPALALGVLMGLLALTNTCYMLGYPLLLWTAFPRKRKQQWQMAGVSAVAFLLLIMPWMVRNAATLDSYFSLRSGMGLQLWLGNQPVSDGWLDDRATYAYHPYFNEAERRTLLAIGEPAYNDLCVERFFEGLRKYPAAFWARCVRRVAYLFIGNPGRASEHPFMDNVPWRGIYLDSLLLNGSVAFLGIGGVLAAWRLGFRSWGLPALALCVILPYLPTAVLDRYSLPLRALLVMYAASLLWLIAVRLRHGAWPKPGASS